MRDVFAEVFTSMKSNKTRIILTGFAIGWGMFILIVLLGAGNGLLHGMTKNFSADSQYTVSLSPGVTSVIYGGRDIGTPIQLFEKDVTAIQKKFNDRIDKILPVMQRKDSASFIVNNAEITLMGEKPGFEAPAMTGIELGRSLNDADISEHRKVCVINRHVANRLFDDDSKVVGSYITINSFPYLVIGIAKLTSQFDRSYTVYIPLTTFSSIYQPDGRLSSVSILTKGLTDSKSNKRFNDEMLEFLSSQKGYSPIDNKAIAISNPYDQFVQVNQILTAITIFLWVIGIATLISGVVGIANIMLITVKERTRELGIRKAMGASDRSIITLVLLESVIITLIFGYVGMLSGVGLTQLLSMGFQSSESGIFDAPTVPFNVIVAANLIMVVAGLIAGYLPAKNAVKIKLVDALSS